jgi:ubiquinone/menaquinone biosynthesis C-methylase UbiE
VGDRFKLLECGCGGNPAVPMLRDGDHYTGVDFSTAGRAEADQALRAWGGTYRLQQADICRLPFSDGKFDAIYSAHVLYHIENAASQAGALQQMARVLRSGGAAVLVLVNPSPLLFPIRSGIRLVADAPVLRSLVNRIRKKDSVRLPVRTMRIGWYARELSPHGTVVVVTGGIPSTWFSRNVTEYRYPSKFLWQAIRFLDSRAPRLSALLGN